MVAAIAIILGITVVVLVTVPWLARAVVNMDKNDEDHVLDPETPKVSYTVPNGVDAAVLRTALTGAGFPAVLELVAGDERLLIECHPGDRERVRETLEEVNRRTYVAAGLPVDAVVFTDER